MHQCLRASICMCALWSVECRNGGESRPMGTARVADDGRPNDPDPGPSPSPNPKLNDGSPIEDPVAALVIRSLVRKHKGEDDIDHELRMRGGLRSVSRSLGQSVCGRLRGGACVRLGHVPSRRRRGLPPRGWLHSAPRRGRRPRRASRSL